MLSIGWRNLRKEKKRMALAVFGVVFAVVLLTVEIGMLLGLVRNASLLIDQSRADIWVSTLDVKTFDFATPLSGRKKYLIRSLPGVEKVEEYNVSYSIWKLPSGGNANVQVVGLDHRGELFAPLNMVEGRLEDLHNRDSVIIDRGEQQKLGGIKLGETVEIMNRKATVVGFTENTRSFTTTPFIFTSLRRGQNYGWLTYDGGAAADAGKNAVYFLVKVAEGYDVEAVRAAIQREVPQVEAHTREAFSWRTQHYWLFETGVGMGFLGSAFMGLLVGMVIVSQTLYAITIEKMPEFGVLKALGASMGDLSRVVLEQGLICGVVGFVVGTLASVVASIILTQAGTAISVPPLMVAGVAVLTMLLCGCASMLSILRLRSLEPAMVFRV